MNWSLWLAQHLLVGRFRASYNHKLNFLRMHFLEHGTYYDLGSQALDRTCLNNMIAFLPTCACHDWVVLTLTASRNLSEPG